ncbi:TetR/AcrR family transcriptional regulator [Pedobacter cryotolerans]|uniref:TetR/AcrR family transcriptional regulator n=1 Tax=Pedobacter cryotolerans TaxID=2571270 RepID=A0A4U1C314_9SPHI|nr:TetR/AcrR family transcriptional regulator [Pedobacter cryotolerans]TKB99589.1 TetR/AcrR family transcriptional regulator [Pedobacter cryotolerans]
MEVKEYIVEEADKLFCQYGFKSVTMDDIAKHLGMSKKTIYQHFSDKDELVNILINEKLNSQECTMDFCAKNAENAVQEIFFVIVNIHEMLSSMNAILFYDLQKHHPKAWLTFKEFREQNLGKCIMVNLERGLSEGLYREELNTEIITQMRLDQIDLIFNQHGQYNMNKFNLAQVMSEITEHFLYGVCNQNGLALIAKYKQQQITQP